ncbi:MAG: alpha/beta hydrolase, partial [Rubrivivax sp.]|nr:alpha/beta hydrolase [Rubrivivax sp.]
SAVQWHAQAAALGGRYRLHAVDIVGDIGLSTQTGALRSRADAAAWLTAVLSGLGIERAAFVGSSFGGFLAANLAVLAPGRVAALALLAPAATLQPFSLAAKVFIRLGSLVPLPATVRPALRSMMGGRLPDERVVRQMEAGVAGFRYDHSGLFPAELPDEELARIQCPTLVLVGTEERIYGAGEATARARALMPRVTAEVLPGLGHLLGLQDAELVNAKLLAFLGQHTDAGDERSRPGPGTPAGAPGDAQARLD